MLDFYKVIILGVLEGLTEFIPISSTGHLIIVSDYLNFTSEFSKTFNISIQLGAILAVLIIFRTNFKEYFKIKPNLEIFPNIIQIILISIPAFIGGYYLHSFIKNNLFSPFTVAVGLIIGSFLMIYADIHNSKIITEAKLSVKKSITLGLFQCLALWPGFSRSGASISGALLLGLDYKNASAVSFICAVPVILGATFYELIKTTVVFTQENIILILVGFFISFIFGCLSILFFLKLISKIKLKPFAIYRIILAIIILYSTRAHAEEFSLIKTPSQNINFKNVKVLETIYNLPEDAYLVFVKYPKLNSDVIYEVQDYPLINLNTMFLRVRVLPRYLFLNEGETKKTISEIILGGLNSYLLFKDFINNNDLLLSFFYKYKINIDTAKRYYIELCLDSNDITTVLWSLEYFAKKTKIIKTPALISTVEV